MTVHNNLTLEGKTRILPKNPITKKVYKNEDLEFSKISDRSYTFFILTVPRSSYPCTSTKALSRFHNFEVTTQRRFNLFSKPFISAQQGRSRRFSQHKGVV